ncbi:hypothetical protein BKE38_26745 [Pseudoroseomonas deserti]|uniref:Schlafen group 3-like DNA/RNA helicase domain-containing protein n=1 Tax=Teichococcus deserti TaxID=1817963 RepID=A0A1V2GUG1_9PROT|nr:DUF2075 domain-containing protein [Pseudoroseomonas deserti]ONG45212.1 hypothetical protein BKE38_26745 [Pseudoroseomonas deserti]
MSGWVEASGSAFLTDPPSDWAARLAARQAGQRREVTPDQIASWEALASLLQGALRQRPGAASWTVLLEFDLLRLEKRIDAVLLTGHAILAVEFKHRATTVTPADLAQVEDDALDLFDFHSGSRAHPVVPILLAEQAPSRPQSLPLIWHGVVPPLACDASRLAGLLAEIEAALPRPVTPLDGAGWARAPYRPVPGIIEAAQRLFDRHGVEEIATARADIANLRATTTAIRRAIAGARQAGERRVVFVTGVPGAGKTLCGLNLVFGQAAEEGAAFLTGNAPLVAVLRGALERDAVQRQGRGRRQPRREARSLLQNVHRFLEHHQRHPEEVPAEAVVVFDEAQRAWDAAQAQRDTQRRRSVLTESEPAHLLEIMGRRAGWSVIVALIGQGQEINTGEAGLAEWGRVIAASRGLWRATAAPAVLDAAAEPAQRLAPGEADWLQLDPDLALTVPVRSVHHDRAADWVDAVLNDRPQQAAGIAAAGELPFYLTRDLGVLRRALRDWARGLRRAGLVCSAKAKRLRAEGLGAQLHGADAEVVNWFLCRWPDIRGSDALEVCATEYACQGLELDLVGLAWGGDFIRSSNGWRARKLSGTRWQWVGQPEAQRHIRNTYRVLLTRARHATLIFVPPGDASDPTRPPQEAEAVATYLAACGARLLADPAESPSAPARLPLLALAGS